MTAEEMIRALRICGNHSSAVGLSCRDCPCRKECSANKGVAHLFLMAADMIEELAKSDRALKAILYDE